MTEPEVAALERLSTLTKTMRREAQGSFRQEVASLVAEIYQFSAAAEKALGEISVDEAWVGVRRVIDDYFTRRSQP